MNSSKIEVRRAVLDDAEAIEKVARASWHAAYAGIILPENQERLLSRWYAPDALQESIAQEPSWFYVALADDRLVAFAQFVIHDDGRGRLTRIYVLPNWQRQTIGSLLLHTGLAALARRNVREVFVEVEKDNRVGKAFYEGKGFRYEREFSIELPEQNLILEELALRIQNQSGAG